LKGLLGLTLPRYVSASILGIFTDNRKYDLTVNIIVGDEKISGDLTYWSHVVTDAQAEFVSDTFFHVLSQLIDPSNSHMGQLDPLGPRSRNRLLELNKFVPEAVQTCIHTDIQQYSRAHITKSAVCDDDEDMKYGQLDQASSLLAQDLVRNGVGPDVFVPVCCEKSRWVVVAILAVLKAGGAFILLDPSHPAERLQGMLNQDFCCPVILASSKHVDLAASIVPRVLHIETDETKWTEAAALVQLPAVAPRAAAYAVFTSGSTGKPKASVIEHRSFRSAAQAHSQALRLHEGSRVLQFASYAFDASIVEILTTLLVGGCICIPNEIDRTRRLSEVIQDMRVTWTLLTPSVARVLKPGQVQTLETLVLGGEGMSENDVRLWSPHVHLINAYGPSECSVVATVQPSPQCLLRDPTDIGFPVGCLTWVVDIHAPEKPMPIGAVGELLIEGPIVGRGYVNRPDHTKAAFLPYPEWMHQIRGTKQGTLYRTGDRARILEDGSIHYMGRKDRQVKLHGQRIELGEIEHQIQQCWPEDDQLVFADLVKPPNSTNAYLVALIVYLDENVKDCAFEAAVEQTQLSLQDRVPMFLIPYAFLPIAGVPRLPNGKVDRSRLRDEASRGLQNRMEQSEGSPKTKQSRETTKDEQILQRLWAQVLHRAVDSIGPDDNFFRLGGDSILVMKLASAAAAQGIKISVPDVFLHPSLKDLARLHISQQAETPETEAQELTQGEDTIIPLSLLPSAQRETAIRETMVQCDVTAEKVEDIYPCTALQAGLAALTAGRPGSYIAHHYFKLGPDVKLDRLKAAWEKVSSHISILRTRLVQTELGCLQAIVRDCELSWKIATGEENEDQKHTWEMLFGQPLIQFEISMKPNHTELKITVHHAVYDAWSLPLLLQSARLAYEDLETTGLRCAPFQRFIQYTMEQKEDSLHYWRGQLSDFDGDPFPSIPFPSYRPQAKKKVQCAIRTGPLLDGMVSRTTAVRLAWALVQSQYQSSDRVIFGVVSSGRSAPVRGIEMMAGPTIATIPLSVLVDDSVTVSQALIDLQEQMLQLIPYEQVGLSQIASVGPGAVKACSFQTLLIEGRSEGHGEASDYAQPLKTSSGDDAANTYILELTIILGTDGITLEAAFDETVLPEWQTQRILDQFGHIIQRVHKEPHHLLKEISTINSRDIHELKRWNREVPNLNSQTVVEVIRRHCAIQPSAPAVCAWDGNLSYGELDSRSNTLASLIFSRGVGPDIFVPIYLERSRWTAVAVLAVLKAGAAFVLLDTFNPHGRLRTICEEIQAPIIITSINLRAAAQSLVSDALVVTEGTASGGSSEFRSPPANPHHALYAVFTSGSTGKPKAAVVENGSFVTMAIPYAREMRLDKCSRMLHFASYAFDVSILEVIGTLFVGSCVCVLSDAERRDNLARAVTNLQPSHAILTPSVLRVVTPTDLSSVHTIMLIGEPVRESDIQQWADRLHLLNTYGPAECTVVFTMKPSLNLNGEAANIGVSIAGATWVTDPRDPQRLVPIGAVGELLLQGPLVGRGYLNNTEQTNASFIPFPSWLQEQLCTAGDRDTKRRVYRTGDLVRYESDGSLCFVGRRDYQVKLRGQRFELGEVESQVQQNFPADIEDVVAQIITPAAAVKTPCLAVFIALRNDSDAPRAPPFSLLPSLDVVIPEKFGEKVSTAKRRLENVLPEYMIPTFFVPFEHLPRTIGGKLDRSRLRESVAKVSRQELDSMFMPKMPDKRRNIATTAESTLQQIWAQALGVVADQIGVEDSFFRLGGDSISALQATSQARAVGIAHSVGDLFQWRTILEIAKRFVPSHELHAQQKDPNVDGVIPCTPAQRGILLNQMQFEQKYAAHFIWQVNSRSGAVDVERLVRAWKAVVSRHSALRVTFQPDPSDDGQFEQILLREVDPPVLIIRDESHHNGVADASLVAAALIKPSANIAWRNDGKSVPHHLTVHSNSSGSVFCRLDINHAILDGMSLAILELDLCHAYDAPLPTTPQPDPYREYINFAQKEPHDEGRKYWESYLKDMKPLVLPRARLSENPSDAPTDAMKRLEMPLTFRGAEIESFCRATDWTPSNLVYFAWALALSALTNSKDVCFAISTSGRLIPVPHIDRAIGQFSNMSICRARMASDLSLNDIALHMQQDYSEILSYQSFPLSEIARAAGVPIEALASTGVIVHYPLPAGMATPLETASLQLTQRRVLDPGIVSVVYVYLSPRDPHPWSGYF
jgi:amino acid adenylation domain-containing protein